MSEILDRFARVSDGFAVRLEGCEVHWNEPTPCPDWTVRDIASHVVRTHRGAMSRLEGGEVQEPARDEDVRLAYSLVSGRIKEALADREQAGTLVQTMTGQQPFEQLVGTLLCADTLAHTWDIARATSQDEQLDTEALLASLAFLEPLDEGMRVPRGFGAKVAPPHGAGLQTRYLCFTGRNP